MAHNLRTVKFASPQDAQISEKLLAHPSMGQLLDKLSATLATELGRIVQVLANMKPGHRFRETGQGAAVQTQLMTGKAMEPGPLQTFELVGPAIPYKPTVFMRLVSEYADQAYETTTDTMTMIYHNEVQPGELAAYRVITMRDFCKNFAYNEWALVDELRLEHADDVFKEKDILKPVDGMAGSTVRSPGGIILP